MMGLFVLACRLSVGGVYLYAAIDKLLHPAAFAQAIHNYRLVPTVLLHPWAHFLPVLEIVVGLALVLGLWRRGAALVAALLTLVFMVAITRSRLSKGSPSSRIRPTLRKRGRAPHMARSLTVPQMASLPISPPGKNRG